MNRTTTRQLVLAAMFTALGVPSFVVPHPLGLQGRYFFPCIFGTALWIYCG